MSLHGHNIVIQCFKEHSEESSERCIPLLATDNALLHAHTVMIRREMTNMCPTLRWFFKSFGRMCLRCRQSCSHGGESYLVHDVVLVERPYTFFLLGAPVFGYLCKNSIVALYIQPALLGVPHCCNVRYAVYCSL